MTIGTFTLLAATGSLVLLKLAIMALVVVLLAKTMFAARQMSISPAVMARLSSLGKKAAR
jgi:hypothetical protein